MKTLRIVVAVLTLLPSAITAEERPPAKVVVAPIKEKLVVENAPIIGVLYFDRVSSLSTEVAGLVKFALQAKEGYFELEAAAAVTAQRALAVQAGLEWLAAQGQVTIVERGDERWLLARGTGPADPQETDEARARLDALLAETAAFRAYARSAPPAALVRARG